MLSSISEDELYINRICFADEAVFVVRGTVGKHSCRIQRSEIPRENTEHETHSPQVNLGCSVMKNVISPFRFEEPEVTGCKLV
jgi:hypothetical protein